jgi:hypothetical protein
MAAASERVLRLIHPANARAAITRALGSAVGLGMALTLPLSGACMCGGPSGPPPPDECDTASAVTITDVELGDTVAPFTPSAHLERVRGGQGLTMLSFRIAVRSDGEPTCIDQTTQAGPTLFGRPLHIASHEGDWWVTAPLFVITDSVAIPVTTSVDGVSVTRNMSIEASADAGIDAR